MKHSVFMRKGTALLVIGMVMLLPGMLFAGGSQDGSMGAASAGAIDPDFVAQNGMKISTTTVALAVGKTATMDVLNPEGTSNRSLVWTSSDESVATVNGNGVVTGVSPGFTTITGATSNGSASGSVRLPVTEGVQEITIMTHQGYGVIKVPSNDLPYYAEAQRQMGIVVKWISAPAANLQELISTRLAARVDMPDLINMVDYSYQDVFDLGANRVFTEITGDLYRQFAPGLFEMSQDDPMLRIQRTTQDDEMWSLPDSLTYTKMGQVGFMLNDYWLSDLGLDPPTTTEELFDVLMAFKTQDPNGNGEADEIPLTNLWSTLDFMGDAWDMKLHHTAYGYSHDEESGLVTSDYTSPEMREYFEYLNRLYENGLLDKEFSANNMDTLAAKVTAMQIGGILEWTLFMRLYDSMYDPRNVDTTGPCPYPVFRQPVAGPEYTGHRTARDSSTGNWVIPAESEIPEIAARLVDTTLTNETIYDIVTFGIEGQSYEIVDGKRRFLIPMAEFNEQAGGEWAFPNKQYGWEDLYWGPRMQSDYDNNVLITTRTNFPSISGTPEEEEIRKRLEQPVQDYFQEMRARFIAGEEPLDNFDEYVDEINRRGAEELLEVYQSIYDKYLEMKASL